MKTLLAIFASLALGGIAAEPSINISVVRSAFDGTPALRATVPQNVGQYTVSISATNGILVDGFEPVVTKTGDGQWEIRFKEASSTASTVSINPPMVMPMTALQPRQYTDVELAELKAAINVALDRQWARGGIDVAPPIDGVTKYIMDAERERIFENAKKDGMTAATFLKVDKYLEDKYLEAQARKEGAK